MEFVQKRGCAMCQTCGCSPCKACGRPIEEKVCSGCRKPATKCSCKPLAGKGKK
jgi:hypothetical protein